MQDGHRKIEVSSRPLKRLTNIQGASPHRVHLEGMWSHKAPFAVEKEIHRLLKSCRAVGEWFFIGQTAAFDAIMTALRTIPGGMLDYDDQPFLFSEHEKPNRGVPKKLTGYILEIAERYWTDPSITSTEAHKRIVVESGQRISLRTLWNHLGKKSEAEAAMSLPIAVAPVPKPKPKRRKKRRITKEAKNVTGEG